MILVKKKYGGGQKYNISRNVKIREEVFGWMINKIIHMIKGVIIINIEYKNAN